MDDLKQRLQSEQEDRAATVVAAASARAAEQESREAIDRAEQALRSELRRRAEARQRLGRQHTADVWLAPQPTRGPAAAGEGRSHGHASSSGGRDSVELSDAAHHGGSKQDDAAAARSRAEAESEEQRLVQAARLMADAQSGPAAASHAAVVGFLTTTIQTGTKDLAEARQAGARLQRAELDLRRRVQFLETRQTELQAHLAMAMKEVSQLQGTVGDWKARAGRVAVAMLPAARAAAQAAEGMAERAVALSSPRSQGSQASSSGGGGGVGGGGVGGPRTPDSSGRHPGSDLSGASPRARRMAARAQEVRYCVQQMSRWAQQSRGEISAAASSGDEAMLQLDRTELEGTPGLLLAESRGRARHAQDALELCEATVRAMQDELSLARAEVTRLTEDAVARANQANELHARLRDAEGAAEAQRLLAVGLRGHAQTLRSLVPERVRPHLPPSPQLRPLDASHAEALEQAREQDRDAEHDGQDEQDGEGAGDDEETSGSPEVV